MKITGLYYFPVTIDPAVPLSDETLVGDYTRLEPGRLSAIDAQAIESSLTSKYNRLCAGKYDPKFARLRVEFDGGRKIVMVDGMGCIKSGREQYYMYPGAFVRTYERLQRILYSQKPKWPA